jgi:UDP-glucose 4-epimerase
MPHQALVTGGAGFIGSHLVERLLRERWNVRVIDDFSTGSLDNLHSVHADLEVIVGDIRDRNACRQACIGVDSVFHLAAIASVTSSVEDPVLSHEVTLGGTLNMLLAARDAGVQRFVYSSSASVYGNAEIVPTTEHQPLDPQSPYASCKASGELYCRNFCTLYGLETVTLRYFNVFGPRQSAHSGYAAVIPCFVKAALNGKSPRVYGDGLQTRDFVYVENIAIANLLAASADGVAGCMFNIAGGESISLLDLLATLERLTGSQLAPEFCPARPGEVRDSRADISHARDLLGYEPILSLQDGLGHTLDAAQQAVSLADLRLAHV